MASFKMADESARDLAEHEVPIKVVPGCTMSGLPRSEQKKFPDFSLTFPWLSTQFPVTVSIYTLWRFLQCIQNHTEITLFINRCFNIVVLKIGQHKGTLSTPWKLSIYLVPNIMQNIKTNKSLEWKSSGAWYLNEDMIWYFILVQISFAKWWQICIDRENRWNSPTFPWLW